MEPDRAPAIIELRKLENSPGMLQSVGLWKPPAPKPRERALGVFALLRALATNPLEAWTVAHFQQPLVAGGLPFARVVVVSEPGAIRRVLLENADNYQKDWMQKRILSAGLADGLLNAEGRRWRIQRRALAPLFARRSVNSFAPEMMQAAQAMIARLCGQCGETVDVMAEVTRLTLSVLERTIFSDGIGADREDVRIAMQRYFEVASRVDPFDILNLPDFVPRPTRLPVRASLKFFEETIDNIIAARRQRLEENPDALPRDLLTLLLDARDPETCEGLTEVEVRANVLTFIAAGHETTANCLTWSLYLLSQSPEWRERVRAEAARELQNDDVTTVADRLPVIRAVIDEANRLYPPISAISRVALAPDTLAGEEIAAGTMVVIAPYVLHRHRALWTCPDQFDPSRFLPGEREKVDRFAYIPFGMGPRLCIGSPFALQEASIALALMAMNFDWRLASGHTVRPMQKMTLRPDGGMPMILRAAA
jgi:cytochrome P450